MFRDSIVRRDEDQKFSLQSSGGSENDDGLIFFPPDSNKIEPLMDYIVEDDFDANIIEEDGSLSSISDKKDKHGGVVQLRKHESPPEDDEYITVELIGEIESEEKKLTAITGTLKEYIAPVISLEDYKKSLNKEIRDAIPIRKKR